MSDNGSGTYVVNSAGQPVVSATPITAAAFNAYTADAATAMSNRICKDGQTTVTANIPFGGYKLTGVGAATARTDAATLASIQDGTGVYVGTVGGTADAITLTPSPAIAAYAAGQKFWFLASGANTGATTVAISGLSAKAVRKNGTTALVANDLLSGAMIGLEYDGTNFQLLGLGQSIISTLATAVSDVSTLQTNSISKTVVDAKGDLLVATADNTVTRKAVGTNGHVLVADSAQSDGLNWVSPATAVNAMGAILNATITVTMAANAVTVALKTSAGTDPSASDVVSVVFRHGTATNGTYLTRTVTGALSTVISSGSSGGTLNNTISRIYVGLLDNAGTIELCWWNPVSTTGLFIVPEDQSTTTTAEGGAGAADSPAVVYSTTARANVYVRYLGYFESTQATAGTWASNASKVQLLGASNRRTGDVVQRKISVDSAVATGTANIPDDDSIPQNTEGTQYMSLSIIPTASANLLDIEHVGVYSIDGGSNIGVALFQDSTANANAAVYQTVVASQAETVVLRHLQSAGTTSSTSFAVRAGGQASAQHTFNGLAAGRKFGGVMASRLQIVEIMA